MKHKENVCSLTSVSIGNETGWLQGQKAVAIGYNAGRQEQNNNAIAIGDMAGMLNQGQNSIAIGKDAGCKNQHKNSIVLNASGNPLQTIQSDSVYIKPIQEKKTKYGLFYDPASGEVSYAKLE